MMVYRSRFTPGLENGKDVHFDKGETVKYKMRSGENIDITIDSDIMRKGDFYGYESIFSDDGQKYFAVAQGIVDWEGKC